MEKAEIHQILIKCLYDNDNFITTAILPYQYPITKSALTSQLMKPVITGGGKIFQVAYFDDFGNVIDKKNINDISVS